MLLQSCRNAIFFFWRLQCFTAIETHEDVVKTKIAVYCIYSTWYLRPLQQHRLKMMSYPPLLLITITGRTHVHDSRYITLVITIQYKGPPSMVTLPRVGSVLLDCVWQTRSPSINIDYRSNCNKSLISLCYYLFQLFLSVKTHYCIAIANKHRLLSLVCDRQFLLRWYSLLLAEIIDSLSMNNGYL